MTDIADFVPYVVPYASGCSDVVAKRAIVESISEFCRESWYYRERLSAQRILATDTVVGDFTTAYPGSITVNAQTRYPIAQTNSEQYVISAPAGMRPYQVIEVQVGTERMLTPINGFVSADVANWAGKEGDSYYFTRLPSTVTEIFPTPTTPDDLVLYVAFIPQSAATEVPNIIFEDYRQVIADGALAKLYAQPDQPYTDMQNATFKNAQFRKGVGSARINAHRNNTRAFPRARAESWL